MTYCYVHREPDFVIFMKLEHLLASVQITYERCLDVRIHMIAPLEKPRSDIWYEVKYRRPEDNPNSQRVDIVKFELHPLAEGPTHL